MTMITLAGTQPNDPVLTNMFMYQSPNPHKHLWGNERLSVNDCFLRNMQKYKYIANIDNDEVNLDDMSVEQILTLIGDVSVTGEKNMCALRNEQPSNIHTG